VSDVRGIRSPYWPNCRSPTRQTCHPLWMWEVRRTHLGRL